MNKIYKRKTSNTDWSRQRKQMSFFASSLYFIFIKYFEQTRKNSFVVECLIFNTTNPEWYLFILRITGFFIYKSATYGPDWRLLEQNVRRPFYVLFVSTVKLVIFDLTALYKLYFLPVIDKIFFIS